MHLTRKPICVLVLFLLSVTAVRADKVDNYVLTEMNRQHVPGVSIVVLKNAKVIKLKGYGLSNIELNVPASPETIYKIGSLSKQFIATGIMLLIEDGKISLDDHVSQFLDGTPDSWKPITLDICSRTLQELFARHPDLIR
jgi:CubicO group peptidase (beta-lactamase class C family)